MKSNYNVIFFDGLCVLCNGSVALLIKIDKKRSLKYSSFQGNFSQTIEGLSEFNPNESVIFWSDGVFYEKADAVINILLRLGGFYKIIGNIFNIFPIFILNKAYDFIARNRYRVFGKNETCMIPAEEVRELFIP